MDSKTFTDFDAFAASVQGVDANMIFRNPKTRIWSVKHVYLPNLRVQWGRLGSGNIVEGQSSADGYLLYLPLPAKCECTANGAMIEPDSIGILNPGSEFCVASKYEHDWCLIHVPKHMIAGGSLPESDENVHVSPRNPVVTRRFIALVNHALVAAEKSATFEMSPASACLEDEFLKVASELVGAHAVLHPTGRPSLPRQEVIRRCNRFLEEYESDPLKTKAAISVDKLATAAQVSTRTLRRVFHEYYGTSPLSYFQLKMFHDARRSLQLADPDEKKVSDVLFDRGIYDLGRFAGRYKKLFGELPSATLTKR